MNYKDFDAPNVFNGISPQYSSTRVMFQTEFSMEEFENVVAEEYKFVNGAK